MSEQQILYLSQADVTAVGLSMAEIIDALERAFNDVHLARGAFGQCKIQIALGDLGCVVNVIGGVFCFDVGLTRAACDVGQFVVQVVPDFHSLRLGHGITPFGSGF